MTSTADIEAEVRLAVIEGADRSLERVVQVAVARGIEAGIARDRARIKAIFALWPFPPGIERAVFIMVESGCSPDEVAGLLAIFEHVSDVDAQARRQSFRLIRD